MIDILCDVGHERCKQFDGSKEHVVKRVSHSIIIPCLDHLDIVICEFMPNEVLDIPHRLVECVTIEILRYRFHGLGISADDPSVGWSEVFALSRFLIDESAYELSDVEDFVTKLPSSDDILLPERVVDTERACRRIVSECIRTILFEDRYRVDDIADRCVHRRSIRCHDESMDHDVLPWDLILDLVASQYGVECPCPDDVM